MGTHVVMELNRTASRVVSQTTSVCPICHKTIPKGETIVAPGWNRSKDEKKNEWMHPYCFMIFKSACTKIRYTRNSRVLVSVPKDLVPPDILDRMEDKADKAAPDLELSWS